MKEHGISQVPVLETTAGGCRAWSPRSTCSTTCCKNQGKLDAPIDELVEADYATVTPQTRIKLLRNIFNDAKLVVVETGDDIVGVITKIDLIEFLAERRA